MNPNRFSSRTSLIEYVREHSPRRAIARAIDEGTVEVLGGFSVIPPGTGPGWLLKITSKHRNSWIIAVAVNEITHTYSVYELDRVPWEEWAGDRFREHPVYDGDEPFVYYRERILAKATGKKSIHEILEEERFE